MYTTKIAQCLRRLGIPLIAGVHKIWATKFCAMEHKGSGVSLRNLLHVTVVAPGNTGRRLDFLENLYNQDLL
jgi:hypothetical protein